MQVGYCATCKANVTVGADGKCVEGHDVSVLFAPEVTSKDAPVVQDEQAVWAHDALSAEAPQRVGGSRLILIAVLVFGLALGTALALPIGMRLGNERSSPKIAELQSRNAAARSEVATLTARLSNLTKERDALKADLAAAKDQARTLKAAVQAKPRLTVAELRLNALRATDDYLNTQYELEQSLKRGFDPDGITIALLRTELDVAAEKMATAESALAEALDGVASE